MRGSIAIVMWCCALGCSASHDGGDGGSVGAGLDASPRDAREAAPDAGADAGGDAEIETGCLPRATEADLADFDEWTRRFYCQVVAERYEGRLWPDLDSCLRYDPLAWEWRHLVWRAEFIGLREGVLVLDRERMDRCIGELLVDAPGPADRERLGWYVDTGWPVCDALAPRCGPLRPGARCTGWYECGDGQWCDPTLDGLCDTYHCAARLPVGAECVGEVAATSGERRASAEASLCIRASEAEPFRCRRGMVREAVGSGQPCGPMALDHDVIDLVPCARGLYCTDRTDLPGARVCTSAPRVGEPCDNRPGQQPCALGAFCDDGVTCNGPTPITPVPVGAACADEAARDQCDAQHRTECVGDVCVEAGRATGEFCDGGFWVESHIFGVVEIFDFCPAGTFCESPGSRSSTCQPRRALGGACRDSEECDSRCCDTGAATCVEPGTAPHCYVDPCPSR